MESLNNIIKKFKELPLRQQCVIAFVLFVLCILSFQNTIVYAVAAVISYTVIDKKLWKYIGVTIFLIATLFSLLLQIPTDVSFVEKANPINSSETEQIETVELLPENETQEILKQEETKDFESSLNLYDVIKVVDGDTLDVLIEGKVERIRLIGINTPETVDPRKPVECFGVEASNKAKAFLIEKKVTLESDSSQGDRDKYNRLLRYVFLEDGTNFNLLMIKEGYAYEYTYDLPYKYQGEFKEAQTMASAGKIGLWGNVCQNTSSQMPNATPLPLSAPVNDSNSCTIKGNISSRGEKIFHVTGCGSYSKTVIDEDSGEKWFCTEQDALNAGWRKALNCS